MRLAFEVAPALAGGAVQHLGHGAQYWARRSAMQYAACPAGVDRVFGTVAAAVSDRRRGLRNRDAVFTDEERQANRGHDNSQA